jgi:hypothetical protein
MMNHYPLVCRSYEIAGAEQRIDARPDLGYDWAIRWALSPFVEKATPRRAPSLMRQARSELFLESRHHGGHRR